jgi:DNA/RNA endonuclease G (NUC1)
MGCEDKVKEKIVYVDSNGTIIQKDPPIEFRKLYFNVSCDDRDYAYYTQNSGYSSKTPILRNSPVGTIQVTCADIKKHGLKNLK